MVSELSSVVAWKPTAVQRATSCVCQLPVSAGSEAAMLPSPADGVGTPDSEGYDPLMSSLRMDDSEFEELYPFQSFDRDDKTPTDGMFGFSSNSSRTQSTDSLASSTSSKPSRNRFLFPKIDTVEPLLPEQVRWFYKGELDKKWTAFIGYDSLRIECKYREVMQRSGGVDPSGQEDEKINCRGGLYQVDVAARKCYPVYWSISGDVVSIMRGTWFLDNSWQPLDEGYADQIETEHLANFENQKIPDEVERGPVHVIHNIKFKEFHVDWNGVDSVYLHSEAASSKFYRAVGTKLGLSKAGTKLHRGYCYEATMDDKPPDITQLVFVVHGIGQKMETGSIIKVTNQLRNNFHKIQDRCMPELDNQEKRAEFLPVEWRSSLKLDGDTVESITPNKVRGLRTMLNSSAMDILYYTSPLYRTEITQGLQVELNRLYQMFCTRNPYFEAKGGKVSIIAHSLGAVICYDIVTGWNPIQLYDQYVSSVIYRLTSHAKPAVPGPGQPLKAFHGIPRGTEDRPIISLLKMEQHCSQADGTADLIGELEEARKRVSDLEGELLSIAQKQHVKTPTLKFKLENMFCLGSPLAVFLALRGVRPKGNGTQDHILPKSLCARLYNVYHPSDPVAYRLEPLILKNYATISPTQVFRYDAPNKVPYDELKPVPLSAMMTRSSKTSKDEKKEDPVTPEKKPEKEKTSLSGRIGGMFAMWSRKSQRPEDIMSAELMCLDKKEKSALLDLDDSTITLYSPTSEKSATDFGTEAGEMKDQEGNSIDQTELEFRLDFQLREGKMENAYLAALTSHTSYWANYDVALFFLSMLFPDNQPS